MAKPAIKVEGLWKEYVIGAEQKAHSTFYDMLSSSLSAPFRALRKRTAEEQETELFWALRDVNFEVQPGEVVGIIGRNGAGKSTLLKILSRITAPTRGRVEVHGRLASLLEVGTGFHPELSGRENIFLNGAILGMTRAEVARKFEEIVEFAEVGSFIDTPVKRYSSGMYVRLAFSVAAHLEPDVLIIDEVLAVGDAEFQQKCIGKLRGNRGADRAVLVVSHNMSMIAQLCASAIWLDRGQIMQIGGVRDVSSRYLSARRMHSSEWLPLDHDSSDFQYQSVSVIAPAGSAPESIAASQSFNIEFRYKVLSQGVRGRLALQIRDHNDMPILSSASTDGTSAVSGKFALGNHVDVCEIPGHLLCPGTYYLSVSLPTRDGDIVRENVCSFRIEGTDSLVSRDGRLGVIAPLLLWRSSDE